MEWLPSNMHLCCFNVVALKQGRKKPTKHQETAVSNEVTELTTFSCQFSGTFVSYTTDTDPKIHDFNEGAKTALMNWLPTRTGVDFITCVKFELCPGSFDVHSCCFNVDALGKGKRMEPTETMASPRSGHYGDVIMSAMASQITGLTIVYSTVYSGADQRKHQCSASLAFAWIWSEFIVSGRMFNCGTKYCWFHWSVSSGVVAWSEVSLAIATLMLLCSVGFR